MMDPRMAVIPTRLAGVRRVIAVTGGKGGIGKSVIATTLALVLASQARTGLFDLDLTSPCDHLLLGIDGSLPEEQAGIVPVRVHGIRFMSLALFSGERPAPLRGEDFTNAMVELLAITQWGELEFLIVDLPPGIADAALDVARLLRRAEYLVVATPSRVVIETVARTLRLLRQIGAPVVGVIENMRRGDEGNLVRQLAGDGGAPFLGSVPFDPALERAGGDAERLSRTEVAAALTRISEQLT